MTFIFLSWACCGALAPLVFAKIHLQDDEDDFDYGVDADDALGVDER